MLPDLIAKNIFPSVLVLLDLLAAAEAAYRRDGWFAGYWLQAAGLTVCAVMMKGGAQ